MVVEPNWYVVVCVADGMMANGSSGLIPDCDDDVVDDVRQPLTHCMEVVADIVMSRSKNGVHALGFSFVNSSESGMNKKSLLRNQAQ